MLEIFPSSKVPEGKASPDMRSRAKYFLMVLHFGVGYYIPLTKEMKKLWGIHLTGGKINYKLTPYDRQVDIEWAIRDIIAITFIQIRDAVGADIQQSLSQQIKDGFEKIFEDKLGNMIINQLDQKLLVEKK